MKFSVIPIQLLIMLRWVAVTGQLLTILLVYYGFGFDLPFQKLSVVLLLSLGVNALFSLIPRRGNLIPKPQVVAYLLYDLGQLTTVLYLTGGLNNPFGVLLLAPVVIAAGFLTMKRSIILYASALVAIVILGFSPYPLPWETQGLEVPLVLKLGTGVALATAILFIALYVESVAAEGRRLIQALNASTAALAKEQRLASLGALAAAAAHELGTPLTTISLITQELLEEIKEPSHQSDLALIMEQLKRCRHILEELAKNFAGEKTLPFEALSLHATIQLVIARLPIDPTKKIQITSLTQGSEPILQLTPELIHGLNNILQNGWQFARSTVTVDLSWTKTVITITISDDGPGYPDSILNRLGEPYVSGRPATEAKYHLGLGLFIAQTLLEKINGILYFNNQQGARCQILLHRQTIEAR